MMYDSKLKHSIEVARLMYKIAKQQEKSEDECRECFLVGFLHDVGYEFVDNVPSEHAEIGARILQEAGFRYFDEVGKHGNTISDFDNEMLWLLNSADMQVDASGNFVGFEERLEDIRLRYGASSKEYEHSKKAVEVCKSKGLFLDEYDI